MNSSKTLFTGQPINGCLIFLCEPIKKFSQKKTPNRTSFVRIAARDSTPHCALPKKARQSRLMQISSSLD
jgi:hypothetical protein